MSSSHRASIVDQGLIQNQPLECINLGDDQFVIQVISSVLVHYLDSQTPPVRAELVGQEDRVRPDTYRGRERDNHLKM